LPTQQQRYRTAADLPPTLPVFPLRGAILLPRAVLPLRVFEPRYLEMIDDALAGARVIVIVQPAAGGEESPAGKSVELRKIGCAGRITAYEELDDGRLAISITGVARCLLTGELATDKAYRLCRVDFHRFADDLIAGCGEDGVDRQGLLKTLKSYLEARRLRMDWSAIAKASNEWLVNALAVASPYGPEEKQALLEAPNLTARAEMLVALAEMELAAGAGGGSGSTLQ
jgi:Lon protease-like protein